MEGIMEGISVAFVLVLLVIVVVLWARWARHHEELDDPEKSPGRLWYEEWDGRRRRMIVDLAHAHDGEDMELAVEIWRRVYEEVDVETVVAAMEEAEERGEYWFGSRVDGALKKSWRKFVEESWGCSRGEFLKVGIGDYWGEAKRFVVEMAEAHRDDDIGAAIESWKGYEDMLTIGERLELERRYADWAEEDYGGMTAVRMLELVMEEAALRGELWLGLRVDAAMKESWMRFVKESYDVSRDDYITNLERGR